MPGSRQTAGVQIAAPPPETSGQLHALSVPRPHGHMGTLLVFTSKAILRVQGADVREVFETEPGTE